MILKHMIKREMGRNTYLNSIFYDLLTSQNNKKIKKITRELDNLDPLEEIDEIREFRRLCDTGIDFSTKNANLANCRIYGIWSSLFPEISEKKAIFTPSIEHGLILHSGIYSDILYTARATSITMGPFRKKIIQEKKKIPVFCSGPYIQYAKPFYSNIELAEKKKKLGRTLLVFPGHSTDASIVSTNAARYVKLIEKYAKDFDSVIVNSFWWNINDCLISEFERAGFIIATAGFRESKTFLSKLRSLFEISDLVLGDSFGTHIGYSLQMQKPFHYYDIGTREELFLSNERNDKTYRQTLINSILDCFARPEDISQKQMEIGKFYWGLGVNLSSVQRQKIMEITKRLVVKSLGMIHLIPRIIPEILEEYKENDQEKYELLLKACN